MKSEGNGLTEVCLGKWNYNKFVLLFSFFIGTLHILAYLVMILFISARHDGCCITTQILYTRVVWHHNHFMALFLGPPGWAGARRELLDFMMQGKINRGRHTDHPAGRHSIQTNQCPPPPHPPYFLLAGYPSYHLNNSVKALKAVVWWWWMVGWHLKVTASKHEEDVHACCLQNVAACRLTEIRSVLPYRFQVIFKILLSSIYEWRLCYHPFCSLTFFLSTIMTVL